MNKVLFALVIATAAYTPATLSHAQGPPTVTTQGTSSACPITNGTGQATGWVPGTICQNATVINCPGALICHSSSDMNPPPKAPPTRELS